MHSGDCAGSLNLISSSGIMKNTPLVVVITAVRPQSLSLAVNLLRYMAFYLHAEDQRGLLRTIMLAGMLFLFLPVVVQASTPPLQPSLAFEIAPPAAGGDNSLTLSATWKASVTYNRPPEYIIVEVFSVPGSVKLGDFAIPRVKDACGPDNPCMYRTSIGVDTFPSGKFVLIATDPLSGSASRQMVTIPPHSGGDAAGFFKQFEQEQLFFIFSFVFAAVLVFLLAILVKKDRSGM